MTWRVAQVFHYNSETREWLQLETSSYEPVSKNAVALITEQAGRSPGFKWQFIVMVDNRPGRTPPPPPPPPPLSSDTAAVAGSLIAVGVVLVAIVAFLALQLMRQHADGSGPAVHVNVVVDRGDAQSKGALGRVQQQQGVEQRRRMAPGGSMDPLFLSAGLQLSSRAAADSPGVWLRNNSKYSRRAM